jgi:hypothetical protein
MSERERAFRTAAITYFPMFIAALSLITSIYNGYLNDRMVDIIQHNLGRSESLRTCKEIIEAYFQVKFQVGLVAESAERPSPAPTALSRNEAINAVNKFAALGTYLANLSEGDTRERYTHLSWELEKIVREAEKTPIADFGKLFERADAMFSDMNRDCVQTAKR